MKQDPEQESQLRRYLLGELRLEEEVLIGQRLFLDSDYAELAQSVEDDLIDDYVHDDLTPVERQEFETHFLETPEHREDLRIAQAFQKHLISTPFVVNEVIRAFSTNAHAMALREVGTQSASTGLEEQQPAFLSTSRRRKPVVWVALAAAILIVLSIISWIVIRSVNKPGTDGLEAQQPQAVPTEPARQQQLNPSLPVNDNQTVERRGSSDEPKKKSTNDQTRRQPKQQPTPATFAAVTIFPGTPSRGTGRINQVTIKSEQTAVNLKLPLPATKNYERYRLELRSGRRRIHVQTLDSRPDEEFGRVVFITLPTSLLTHQRYEMKLHGIASNGSSGEPTTYSFTIKKEP